MPTADIDSADVRAAGYANCEELLQELVRDRAGDVYRIARCGGRLSEQMGQVRKAFRSDVRKLKALGLTISLKPGCRLAFHGQAALRALCAAAE